jgi:hypothetical protein
MANTNVNVYYARPQSGGQSRVASYSTSVTMEWTDENGQRQTQTKLFTFPDDLYDVTFPVDLREEMIEEALLKYARWNLGVN